MLRTIIEWSKIKKMQMKMIQHRNAQGETGFSASVWFWVLLALFIAAVVVIGYLLARKFLPSPDATREKLVETIQQARE